jgi:hypothetical protein
MIEGSPTLATLIVALGGAIVWRALVGGAVLERVVRRAERHDSADPLD